MRLEVERKTKLREGFKNTYNLEPELFISSPGRMEIIGNHTDHNHGLAIAAAVDLDIVAAIRKNDEGIVRALSEGVNMLIEIDVNDLVYRPEEVGQSIALVRGVLFRLANKGYKIAGMDLYLDTRIPRGAGVSSSAAYELLFAKAISVLYNDDAIDKFTLAEAGQYAEVNYFGKPCGLLDQIAVSYGAISYIDFARIEQPTVETISYELDHYDIILINTGGSHGNLTDEYEAITDDMREISRFFKVDYLREVDYSSFLKSRPTLYRRIGGRPLLRAMHFFNENDRVLKVVECMKKQDERAFVKLIAQSGASSYNLLQNYTFAADKDQQLFFAYNWAKTNFRQGAYRVHGGGFAGTMLAFIPKPLTARFIKAGEVYFGEGNLLKIKIREAGVTLIE